MAHITNKELTIRQIGEFCTNTLCNKCPVAKWNEESNLHNGCMESALMTENGCLVVIMNLQEDRLFLNRFSQVKKLFTRKTHQLFASAQDLMIKAADGFFENDILSGHIDVEFPEDETRKRVVWHENGWCTNEPGCDYYEELDDFDSENFEVIGNMIDNPELLEV